MTKSKKKVLFINTVPSSLSGAVYKKIGLPPAWYSYLAALTPPEWEVSVIDENVEKFSFQDADIVGISVLTTNAPRSYEIAQIYREKGIPVVLGGVHATSCKEEASQNCSAVVLGEAESVWAEVLNDFLAGNLKKEYNGELVEIGNIIPRRDVLPKEYSIASISTSRGCPFACDYCSVTVFNGAQIRFRPVSAVVEEMKIISQKVLFFLDDNIIPPSKKGREHAKELFEEIIKSKVNKIWFAQSTYHFGLDKELVNLAYQAGCRMISMGIESFDEEVLKGYKKFFHSTKNKNNVQTAIDNIHRAGIIVKANFILGNDLDVPQNYIELNRNISKLNVDIPLLTILTPLPGTPIFNNILNNNRLLYQQFPGDWKWYNSEGITIRPNNHRVEQQISRIEFAKKNVYSLLSILMRVFKALYTLKDLQSALLVFRLNLQYRKDSLKTLAEEVRGEPSRQ